jgi:hypothetical protein
VGRRAPEQPVDVINAWLYPLLAERMARVLAREVRWGRMLLLV